MKLQVSSIVQSSAWLVIWITCVISIQALDNIYTTTEQLNNHDNNVTDVSAEISVSLNASKVVSKLPHFWTNTGFW